MVYLCLPIKNGDLTHAEVSHNQAGQTLPGLGRNPFLSKFLGDFFWVELLVKIRG